MQRFEFRHVDAWSWWRLSYYTSPAMKQGPPEPEQLEILFLEPFYGGSHRSFCDGLVSHSRHKITLTILPARFWKWRMRGSALHFAHTVYHPERYDLIICSDMLSLLDLKGLWGESMPPSVLYFHENQLSYPVPEGERMDYHFAFTNITSAVAADSVIFNSEVHLNAFFAEADRFLTRLPEYAPRWALDEIQSKSVVMYPGCNCSEITQDKDDEPLVIWNHRWEFDKRPDVFFAVLEELAEGNVDFRVAILGENFQAVPTPFIDAKAALGDRIVQYGYIKDYAAYRRMLERGWVVVSTAIQENFGISVVEAMNAGCYPLLPHRLSYPEIVPAAWHEAVLYENDNDLLTRLAQILGSDSPPQTADLVKHSFCYSWKDLTPQYDSLFSAVAQ